MVCTHVHDPKLWFRTACIWCPGPGGCSWCVCSVGGGGDGTRKWRPGPVLSYIRGQCSMYSPVACSCTRHETPSCSPYGTVKPYTDHGPATVLLLGRGAWGDPTPGDMRVCDTTHITLAHTRPSTHSRLVYVLRKKNKAGLALGLDMICPARMRRPFGRRACAAVHSCSRAGTAFQFHVR